LLTVPIEIDHDRTDGSLSFIPAGAVSVEYAFLTELSIADRAGYLDRRRSAEEIELDPWNAESMQEEYEGLLRSIDLDGTSAEQRRAKRTARDALRFVGVCICGGGRPTTSVFLDAQRQVLLDAPEAIPLPIASLVVDEPSRLVAGVGTWARRRT